MSLCEKGNQKKLKGGWRGLRVRIRGKLTEEKMGRNWSLGGAITSDFTVWERRSGCWEGSVRVNTGVRNDILLPRVWREVWKSGSRGDLQYVRRV